MQGGKRGSDAQTERESESVCGLNGGGGPKFTAGASARVVMFVSSG